MRFVEGILRLDGKPVDTYTNKKYQNGSRGGERGHSLLPPKRVTACGASCMLNSPSIIEIVVECIIVLIPIIINISVFASDYRGRVSLMCVGQRRRGIHVTGFKVRREGT